MNGGMAPSPSGLQPTELCVLEQILGNTLCTFWPLRCLMSAEVFNNIPNCTAVQEQRLMFTCTLIPLACREMKVSHAPWPFFFLKYDTRKPKACVTMGRGWRRKVMACVCFSCREATNLSYCLQVSSLCSECMYAEVVKLEMMPL